MRLATWFRTHPGITDALLALTFAAVSLSTALSVTSSEVNDDLSRPDEAWQWVLIVLGSVDLTSDARRSLQSLAGILNDGAGNDFEARIVGHTDGVPIRKPETKRRRILPQQFEWRTRIHSQPTTATRRTTNRISWRC